MPRGYYQKDFVASIVKMFNLYIDKTKQIDMADFITLTTSDVTQQTQGYLDTYGGLNLGGSGAIQAINVLGSVLNGQGVGISKSGPVTNFDIRSSLAGRVLGASGLINDTKLGTIGGQQLVLALANNAAFNIQQELLGLKRFNKESNPELSTRLKYMITSLNGEVETPKIREFVDTALLARDSRALREYIQQIQPDVDLTFFPESGGESINIPIGLSFFWPDL